MKVSIAPSLVAISSVCSIICRILRVRPSVFQQGHNARGCRGSSHQLQRKDADLEPLHRESIEVGELLHVPVGLALADAVSLPGDIPAAFALGLGDLMLERRVPTLD